MKLLSIIGLKWKLCKEEHEWETMKLLSIIGLKCKLCKEEHEWETMKVFIIICCSIKNHVKKNMIEKLWKYLSS